MKKGKIEDIKEDITKNTLLDVICLLSTLWVFIAPLIGGLVYIANGDTTLLLTIPIAVLVIILTIILDKINKKLINDILNNKYYREYRKRNKDIKNN